MTKKPKNGQLKVDFNAAALLESHLTSPHRRHVKGLTIDKPNARILDDGIFIRRDGEGWTVEISIADMPAMVPEKHPLEFAARKMGYERNARERLFPYGFLLNYASLQDREKRPAITFTIALDRDLDMVSCKAERTVFESLKQCNDNDIAEQLARQNPEVEMWVDLGQALFAKRMKDAANSADTLIANDGIRLKDDMPVYGHKGREGEALVHEMMRLANIAATRILYENGLEAPFKKASGVVNIIHTSADMDFDLECNRLALDAVTNMAGEIPPYAHISSPMREYKDFLGLKILARFLEGKAPDAADQAYARKLSDEFNNHKKVTGKEDICAPEWGAVWQWYRQHQNRSIHQKIEQDSTTAIGRLRAYCKAQGWKAPQLAERQLLINGIRVTLAGLRCDEAGKATGWSVHHDADGAVNLAAMRVQHEMGMKP